MLLIIWIPLDPHSTPKPYFIFFVAFSLEASRDDGSRQFNQASLAMAATKSVKGMRQKSSQS